MSLIRLLGMLIGFYILYESIVAASEMNRGDRACRMAKYLLSATCGLVLILYQVDFKTIFFGLTVAAFTWNKVASRYKKIINKSGVFDDY